MERIESHIKRWLLPVATSLNNIKAFSAIRDAFLQILPFTLVGSFAVCINNVFVSPKGIIGHFLVKLIPNVAVVESLFESILVGTITIMSLLVVFLVGRNLTKEYGCDELKGGLTSVVVFFILYPPILSIKEGAAFTTTYFGAQGLFVAIVVGLVVGWSFSRLSKFEKLKINMIDQVPPEVLNSFKVMIPVTFILVAAATLNFLLTLIVPEGLNGLIYEFIQAPFSRLGASPVSLLLVAFTAQLLWALGIHGTSAVSPISGVLYAEANMVNMNYALANGTTVGSPYPYTWLSIWEHYGSVGGSGNTLGLLLAILIVASRHWWQREDFSQVAKLSLFPGIFGINEPLLFGLPVVLNPILIVPFILAPLVNMSVGILSIYLRLVPPAVLDAGWTTPQPIKQFVASGGAWQAILAQIICLAISTLIYLPFVLASNNANGNEQSRTRFENS
ncbi:PTS transporter subunit EIIC [uncultured Vagococcus sp.]|uniref:PTS sugar transporter subunit IIC n=1 Tax=uncultured Vagococcus sp. TaxID=189676 RepID=UPI0028D07C58|nr:PTS transporter subunit EIIC [uncultured Vagococcus sp.]